MKTTILIALAFILTSPLGVAAETVSSTFFDSNRHGAIVEIAFSDDGSRLLGVTTESKTFEFNYRSAIATPRIRAPFRRTEHVATAVANGIQAVAQNWKIVTFFSAEGDYLSQTDDPFLGEVHAVDGFINDIAWDMDFDLAVSFRSRQGNQAVHVLRPLHSDETPIFRYEVPGPYQGLTYFNGELFGFSNDESNGSEIRKFSGEDSIFMPQDFVVKDIRVNERGVFYLLSDAQGEGQLIQADSQSLGPIRSAELLRPTKLALGENFIAVGTEAGEIHLLDQFFRIFRTITPESSLHAISDLKMHPDQRTLAAVRSSFSATTSFIDVYTVAEVPELVYEATDLVIIKDATTGDIVVTAFAPIGSGPFYFLEESPDLETWSAASELGNQAPDARGIVEFRIGGGASGPVGFYRVRIRPPGA